MSLTVTHELIEVVGRLLSLPRESGEESCEEATLATSVAITGRAINLQEDDGKLGYGELLLLHEQGEEMKGEKG